MKYCLPKIPDIFWIYNIFYQCKSCGHDFELLLPKGDDIVKYQEENGFEVRWLPTYGKGGYIELLAKLIPNYKFNTEITVEQAKQFDKELQKFTEPSNNGNVFTLADYRHICPQCKSKNLQLLKEELLISPNIKWLEISCSLIL